MSIFDTIKYPISDPVRLGEITSLPEKILIDEINRTACEDFTTRVPTIFLFRYVEMCIIESGSWTGKNGTITVQSLRKALKEYDNGLI